MNYQIYKPIYIVILYLVVVYLMFIFSPWGWDIDNHVTIFILYLFSLIAIFSGHKIATAKQTQFHKKKLQAGYLQVSTINKTVFILIIVYLISFYPRAIVLHNQINLSLNDFFDKVFIGIYDSSIVYFLRSNNDSTELKSLFNPITFFVYIISPFVNALIPIGIFYFNKLKTILKVIFILCIGLHVMLYFSIGTNKGLFDLLIAIIFIRLIKVHILKKTTFKNILVKISLIIIFLFTINYFSESILKRKSDNVTTSDFTNNVILPTNNIYKYLPNYIANPYISFDFYMTHGFYNLDKAINKEWEWTYGLGNSEFFLNLSDNFIGKDIIRNKTFEKKLEYENKEYKIGKYWTTAFTPIANDIHWIGIPFLLLFISYYWSKLLLKIHYSRNIFDIPLYILYVTFFLYLPLNNSVLSNFESLISLFTYIIIKYLNENNFFKSRQLH